MNKLLLIYQLSILKNKPLKFTYVSNGYLNSSIQFDFVNDIKDERDVFEETAAKYNFYKYGIIDMMNNKFSSIFFATKDFEKQMNSLDFCKIYSNYNLNNRSISNNI